MNVSLNITLQGSYRSKQGNVTFRYAVTGSEADMAAYKEAQGDFHRTNPDGTVLWFTTRFAGPKGKLIITQNKKCIADMSAFDAAASLASQYGGNFGQEIAKGMTAQLLGNGAVSNTPAAEATEVHDEGDLDKH